MVLLLYVLYNAVLIVFMCEVGHNHDRFGSGGCGTAWRGIKALAFLGGLFLGDVDSVSPSGVKVRGIHAYGLCRVFKSPC